MEWFLHNGSTGARLARTLVEVVLAWVIANIGDIFNLFEMDGTLKTLVVSGLTVLFTATLGFINDNRIREDPDE